MNVRGAVCLVTGASSGIGRAVALRLTAEGAHVIALGRDADALAGVGDRAIVCDLAQPGGPARASEEAGPVDVLVNNAGIGWAGKIEAMQPETIDRVVEVNLLAPMLLTRALLPGMLGRRRGHIVNVASIVGHVGGREEAVYAATKAGLIGFTESLRQELVGRGIQVSLVTPGVIATEFFDRRGTPYTRRWPRPIASERVADAVIRAIAHDRPEVFVPRWLAVPPRLRGALPRLYRALARRFA